MPSEGASPRRGWLRFAALTAALGACFAALGGASDDAAASRVYVHAGRVTRLRANTVTVGEGQGALEFDRSDLGLREVRVGDQVVVRYVLDARGIEPASSVPAAPSRRRQLPGEASPDRRAPAPKASPAREKPGPYIDDRAFYDARAVDSPATDAPRTA
jgi:hypothetical protein